MGKTEAHRKDAVYVAKTWVRQGQESTGGLSQEQEMLSRYKVSCRPLAVGRKTVTKKCPLLTIQGILFKKPGPVLSKASLLEAIIEIKTSRDSSYSAIFS